MLNKYAEEQSIVYSLLTNEIKNDQISHAYLFDENNCSYAFDLVISFIKDILCSKLDVNSKELLCQKIDDGNYTELKIIEPDGMFIKKQQILDLQNEFSMSAIEGNKRIYVVREAEKMRSETANSMLKFLEEPENNVVAILMTNNFNILLPTIISRCQVVRLNDDNNNVYDNNFDKMVLNFIINIENNGLKEIVNEQQLLFDNINIKEREKYIIFFDKMIDMYYDILKIFNKQKNVRFIEFFSDLEKIAVINDREKILKKINYLLENKDRIKNNVNINLLIDDLIINIGGKYENSWS